VRAGLLRHRISIQEPQETQDEHGAIVTTWSEIATNWASVEPSNGTERWLQNMDQEVVQRPYRVRMRYRADVTITEKCRIVWKGHTFDILSIANQYGRGAELVMLCDEVNP
jgi:SPP1 family predicted phage head-tail adaptor